MIEIKFADSCEMDIEKIKEAIFQQIAFTDDITLYNEEDEMQINALYAEISSSLIDKDESLRLGSALGNAVNDVSYHSFCNGLTIGLSLCQNLITAELPEISVIHKEIPAEKDDFIRDFSRVYKKLTFRERMCLMAEVYNREEKHDKNKTLTENEKN